MRRKIKPNLFELKQRLALLTGEEYSWAAMAREIDVNVRTLTELASEEGSRRADFATFEKILAFLRSKGMTVTLCDLLIEVDMPLDADAG